METIIEGSLSTGDYLPDITVFEYQNTASGKTVGPKIWKLPDLAHQKKIVCIGVTGAFIPVCHNHHLPGFLKYHRQFLQKGIDELWCISVNDPFVMNAWAENLKVKNRIRMLCNPTAELAMSFNGVIDLSSRGMGLRTDRFAMVINKGQIVHFVEEAPGQCTVTDAKTILMHL